VSHLLDGVSIYQVVETQEAGIYVTGYDYSDYNETHQTSTVISRIDARTDEVLAQRSFDDYVEFVIAPNPEA
jgi:hypothetical protein